MINDSELLLTQQEFGDVTIDSVYVMEEAITLSEAAEKLEDYASYLRGLEDIGWQLEETIEGEFGYIVKEGVEQLLLDNNEDLLSEES